MIVLHTHKPDYEPSARHTVLGQFVNTTYLGTDDQTAFALILSGHAELTARDPRWACRYALYFIKGRWPEAEAVIATDPYWAYHYALYGIQGRWPEAEALIAANSEWAYWYARDVIKDRWPEAEAVIATDPIYKGQYEQALRVEL